MLFLYSMPFVQSQSARCKSLPWLCSKVKQHSTSPYNARAWQTTFQAWPQHPNTFNPHSKYINTVLVMENIKDHRGRKGCRSWGRFSTCSVVSVMIPPRPSLFYCIFVERWCWEWWEHGCHGRVKPCSHNTPAEQGKHCQLPPFIPQGKVTALCQASTSTAKDAPEATSHGFHTPPQAPSASGPPQAEPPSHRCRSWGEAWQAQSPQTAPLACDWTGTRTFISESLALPWLPGEPQDPAGRWEDGCCRPQDTEHSTHNAASVQSMQQQNRNHFISRGSQAWSHHWHWDNSPKWQRSCWGRESCLAPVSTAVCKSFKHQGLHICPPTVWIFKAVSQKMKQDRFLSNL